MVLEFEHRPDERPRDLEPAAFETLLTAVVRMVERCGVHGQDAESIAMNLIARPLLRASRGPLRLTPCRRQVDNAVKDFLRSETRRMSREGAVARPEAQRVEPPDLDAVEILRSVKRIGRRAAVRALRAFRTSTDPEDLRAFAYVLLGTTLDEIARRLPGSRSKWSRKVILLRAQFQAELRAEAVSDAGLQELVGFDRLLRRVARAWSRSPPADGTTRTPASL